MTAVKQIKSRERVANHGEVFTPEWLVNDMLDLVKREVERVDSRVLEPACGSGNFLVQVLRRKLDAVEATYRNSQRERADQALYGLMCIYGIELLPDNVNECRKNLIEIFADNLKLGGDDEYYLAASHVLRSNIVQGNALKGKDSSGRDIVFPEWTYDGSGEYQRRDFQFKDLMRSHELKTKGALFENQPDDGLIKPIRDDYPLASVRDLAMIKTETLEKAA